MAAKGIDFLHETWRRIGTDTHVLENLRSDIDRLTQEYKEQRKALAECGVDPGEMQGTGLTSHLIEADNKLTLAAEAMEKAHHLLGDLLDEAREKAGASRR